MRTTFDKDLAVYSLTAALCASALTWSEPVTLWLFGDPTLELLTVVLAGMGLVGATAATWNRAHCLLELRRLVIERGTLRVRSVPVQRVVRRDRI